MKKTTLYFLLFSFFFTTCQRAVEYSDIPEIKLISFEKYSDEKYKDAAKLSFSFTDGKGDIGLNDTDLYTPFDLASIYYYNFFCDYYEKQNGAFVKIELPMTLNARIPRLSKLSEESIKGEVQLIMPFYYDLNSEFDTIQMSFYIVDRKLNESNVEIAEMIR